MLEDVNLWCVGFKFIPCPLFPGPIKLLHIRPIHSHQPACLSCNDGLHRRTVSRENKSHSFKWLLVRERKTMNTTVLEKRTATYSLPLPTSRQSLSTPCSYALSLSHTSLLTEDAAFFPLMPRDGRKQRKAKSHGTRRFSWSLIRTIFFS